MTKWTVERRGPKVILHVYKSANCVTFYRVYNYILHENFIYNYISIVSPFVG